MELFVKPEILMFCIYGLKFGNAESFPMSQLYVNTLPATRVTLITDGV
jgi:hypothetical protein